MPASIGRSTCPTGRDGCREGEGDAVPRKIAIPAARPQEPPPEEFVEKPPAQESLRENIARRLRSAYVREYQRWHRMYHGRETSRGNGHIAEWDGGQAQSGRRHSNVWLKIADLLIMRNRLDPEGFVVSQLGQGFPQHPNMLLSEAAWSIYQKIADSADARLEVSWRNETRQFRLQVTKVAEWLTDAENRVVFHWVLVGEDSGLSALFRYIAGYRMGMQDIVTDLHEPALTQILANPEGYAKHWGSKIPRDLLREVEEILKPRSKGNGST